MEEFEFGAVFSIISFIVYRLSFIVYRLSFPLFLIVVAFSVVSCFFVGVHEVVFHGFFRFDSKSAKECKSCRSQKNAAKCAIPRYQRCRYSRERAFQSFYEIGGPKQELHPSCPRRTLRAPGRHSRGDTPSRKAHREMSAREVGSQAQTPLRVPWLAAFSAMNGATLRHA